MTSLYPLLTRWGMRGYRRLRCVAGVHRHALRQRVDRLYSLNPTESGIPVTVEDITTALWCCVDCEHEREIGAFVSASNHRKVRRAP